MNPRYFATFAKALALVAILANLLGWAFVDCRSARIEKETALQEAVLLVAFADASDICQHSAPDKGGKSDPSPCQHCLLTNCHYPSIILPAGVGTVAINAPVGHPITPDAVDRSILRLPLFAEARAPPSRSQTV